MNYNINNNFCGREEAKDIIKFAFEAISNDNPSKTTALVFRAFLSGISDNHTADYNTFRYLGRGENFRTYQGFDRTVSFSFKKKSYTKYKIIKNFLIIYKFSKFVFYKQIASEIIFRTFRNVRCSKKFAYK